MSTATREWGDRIDPASGVALYYQIKQDLERRITSGELGPGVALPSEQELCDIARREAETLMRLRAQAAASGIALDELSVGATPTLRFSAALT